MIRRDGDVLYVPEGAPPVHPWVLVLLVAVLMAIPLSGWIGNGYTPGRAAGVALLVVFGALALLANRNRGHPTKVDTVRRTVEVFNRSPASFDVFTEVLLNKSGLGLANRYGGRMDLWSVRLNTGLNTIELFAGFDEASSRAIAQCLSTTLGKPLRVASDDPTRDRA